MEGGTEVRITVHFELPNDDSIKGFVWSDGSRRRRFAGWLELLRVLEDLRGPGSVGRLTAPGGQR